MELKRTLETWDKCSPLAMSNMSQAAISYALQDAKDDIKLLAFGNFELASQLCLVQEQNKALVEALQSMDRVLLDANPNCSSEFLFKQIQNAFGIGRVAWQEAGAA